MKLRWGLIRCFFGRHDWIAALDRGATAFYVPENGMYPSPPKKCSRCPARRP